MGDGCFHGDDLLGPLLFLDVVGPQDDLDGAAERAEWGVGVWNSWDTAPGAVKGRWQLGWAGLELMGKLRQQEGPGLSCLCLLLLSSWGRILEPSVTVSGVLRGQLPRETCEMA